MRTVDQMMERMGFPTTETGPYVTELRALVARQISEGMVNRSAGTWSTDPAEVGFPPAEDRAKAFLAVEWELQHAHSFEVKSFDGPIERTFDTRTMRRSIRVHPDLIVPWVGDRWRELLMQLRIWRDRYILRRVNPYN